MDNLISIRELKRLLEQNDETIYLPIVMKPPEPPEPSLPFIWDSRLTQRGAALVKALPPAGEWYWRLIIGEWQDVRESAGKHHIFMDLLDEYGNRFIGGKIEITWNGGRTTVMSETKPGEPYGANYPMHNLAPAFSAQPLGGDADRVTGMGLGSIEDPYHAIHTSYGLVWQWTKSN